MPKYEYKVVRSFGPGCSIGGNKVSNAFNEGWEFVRASEFIQDNNSSYGYIEYILRREIGVRNDN